MAAELASANINPDNHLILESPLLKVPYELARKNHKSAQRNVEREKEQLLSSIKKAASQCRHNASSTAHQNGGEVQATTAVEATTNVETLDSMIQRMESLKRKLETLHTEEETIHRATRARIELLQELHHIPSTADVKFEKWSKIRLNRLLVDYMLRLGYDASAVAFAKETAIEKLVDVDAFVQFSKVERSLQEGRTNEALAWCSENKAYLKKSNSSLEFELRLQQFIELVRTRDISKLIEAILHARKYLGTHPEFQQSFAATSLIAYKLDIHIAKYKDLYAPARWTHLSNLFLKTHHALLSLPTIPALHVALSAGLSCLKTPSCHSIHAASSGNASTSTSGTSVCPICSTELNELARDVPYANHTMSSIESDPVVLPNGRIYGRGRLSRLNEKLGGRSGDGFVRDPMDPSVEYRWGDVRKVFIT